MAKTSIDPSKLSSEIQHQLRLYHQDVVTKLNAVGLKAINRLVNITKRTAPELSGQYRKSLTHTAEMNYATGDKQYIWGAKAPHYRLTHLLVDGHLGPDGRRVPGDPFLKNALDTVLPEYEAAVEEVLAE